MNKKSYFLRLKILIFLTFLCLINIFIFIVPIYFVYNDYILKTDYQNLKNTIDYINETFPFNSIDELIDSVINKKEKYYNYLSFLSLITNKLNFEYIYIMIYLDNKWYFVISSDDIYDPEKQKITEYLEPPDYLNVLLNNKSEIFTKPYNDEEGSHISYFKPIYEKSELKYVYGIDYSLNRIIERNRKINRYIIFGLFLFLIILIVSLLLFDLSFIKPIIDIKLFLNSIFKGNEKDIIIDIKSRINKKKYRDEIGELVNYLNLTFDNLFSLVKVIKKQIIVLSDLRFNLNESVKKTNITIDGINFNIGEVKNKTQDQYFLIQKTTGQVEKIVNNFENLNKLIECESKNIVESTKEIKQMLESINNVNLTLTKNSENIEKLNISSLEGKNALKKIFEVVKNITFESEKLIQISQLIQNISDETKLLSMNASIEAAHYGNYGKGFAIVAKEIRKLAENSEQNIKVVNGVVNNIRNLIETINISFENIMNRFEQIEFAVKSVSEQENFIRKSMELQNVFSHKVLDSINKINNYSININEKSNEMIKENILIINETKELKILTEEITKEINELVLKIDYVNSIINEVNKITIQNNENINFLNKKIEKFEID